MIMGPFQMADLAGNDVGYNIQKGRGWVRDTGSPAAPANRPPVTQK
jgi:3-hydroxyacyl-CoA dehydrogenase